MAVDPELIAETRAWLTKSANDIRAAQVLIDGSPPLLDEPVSTPHSRMWLTRLQRFTEYAWRFRYPGDPDGIDVEEAMEALKVARLVHEAIAKRVPPDAQLL